MIRLATTQSITVRAGALHRRRHQPGVRPPDSTTTPSVHITTSPPSIATISTPKVARTASGPPMTTGGAISAIGM